MHDLKFMDAVRIKPWAEYAQRTYSFSACEKAAGAYTANHFRNNGWAYMPGFMFMIGEHWAQSLAEADASLKLNGQKTQELFTLASFLMNESTGRRDAMAMLREHAQSTQNAIDITSELEAILPTFAASLEAMLINAWTAFEVLSGDLLNSCLDEHPECFAHQFDRTKFRFISRTLMREAYETAFVRDVSILNPLKDLSTDAISLLRNLLVHKAGIVDDKFKIGAQEVGCHAWASLPEGNKFEITGAVVRDLIDRNLPVGFNLIRAVDNWLIAHKPV